jgi:hypothetical protein
MQCKTCVAKHRTEQFYSEPHFWHANQIRLVATMEAEDDPNDARKLFSDEEVNDIRQAEKQSKWNEKQYIRERRKQKEYWEHVKGVAQGLVRKQFPNIATQFGNSELKTQLETPLSFFKNPASKDSTPGTTRALSAEGKIPTSAAEYTQIENRKHKLTGDGENPEQEEKRRRYYISKDAKNPYNRETYLPPEIRHIYGTPGHKHNYGTPVSDQEYVPFDRPSALYVHKFHPSAEIFGPVEDKPDEVPQPSSEFKANVPVEKTPTKSSMRQSSNEIRDSDMTGNNDESFSSMPAANQNERSPERDAQAEVLALPVTNNNAPEQSEQLVLFPYSIVDRINKVFMTSNRKREVQKQIKIVEGVTSVFTVHEYLPYSKEELEFELGISIADNPVKTTCECHPGIPIYREEIIKSNDFAVNFQAQYNHNEVGDATRGNGLE